MAPQLLVPSHHENLRQPSKSSRSHGESSARPQRDGIFGRVALRPEVRRPDETGVHDGSHYSDRNGLLLLCLTTGAAAPAENQGVDAVRADGEDDHANVSARCVTREACGDETDRRDNLRERDVPCTFVELARRPRNGNSHRASDEVGGTREDEGDGL